MFIPKLHAFPADKAEAMLSDANRTLVTRRKTMESPPEDGAPTEEQYDEIRFMVSQQLLHEFRASIEMDAFEEIDGYCAINGTPETTEEISAFWSEMGPKIVTPILQECTKLQGGPATFDLAEFEPWTEAGIRPFCIALASKLRSAVLEIDNVTFARVTELDESRIALIGTTEWVEAGESPTTASGAKKPPKPPPMPSPSKADPGSLDSHVTPPERIGRKGRPPKNELVQDQHLVSAIWVNLGRIMDWEINKFCEALGISTPTMRNYTSGKKAKLSRAQADLLADEMHDRQLVVRDIVKQLDQFKNSGLASE